MTNSVNTSFWLLTGSLFIFFIGPAILQDGMFMDGVQYACVSKNLSEGYGTFWFPHLSQTWMKAGSSNFMEHPTLVYALQAAFFKVLGPSMYTERIYSFITAIISAILIVFIWRLVFKEDETLKKFSWFPVLIWLLIPLNIWGFRNNIMENTMTVFTVSSVYFSLRAVKSVRFGYIWAGLAGFMIFAASLSKGLPGLFPIVLVFLYKITHREFSLKLTIIYTGLLFFIPAVIYLLLMQNETAYESISYYYQERLMNRISNEPTVNSRFSIIFQLFSELIPVFIIGTIIIVISKKKKLFKLIQKEQKMTVLFFILLGLSASLPLVLTPVQRNFYLLPSFPYFSIAFSLAFIQITDSICKRINVGKRTIKLFKVITLTLPIAAVVFTAFHYGSFNRHEDLLEDVYTIKENVPSHTTIKVDEHMYENWYLHLYLLRYADISISESDLKQEYFLTDTKINVNPIGQYEYVPLSLNKFYLLKRKAYRD